MNSAGICKQLTTAILYEVTSRLVTHLKFIYSSKQFSNVPVLTVSCSLSGFVNNVNDNVFIYSGDTIPTGLKRRDIPLIEQIIKDAPSVTISTISKISKLSFKNL
jgi:hypothetical protein